MRRERQEGNTASASSTDSPVSDSPVCATKQPALREQERRMPPPRGRRTQQPESLFYIHQHFFQPLNTRKTLPVITLYAIPGPAYYLTPLLPTSIACPLVLPPELTRVS